MNTTNKREMTWQEWRSEAGYRDVAKYQSLPRAWRRDMLAAWQAGVDPTEYKLSQRVAA
jgi:hypothetical protein